jgi:hypothetical protein
MKASHEEANYRCGRLGRRCGNCAMFRDFDMRVHQGAQAHGMDAYEGASRQGRDEYDEPPFCTAVMSPIAIKDVCDYFQEMTARR